MQFEKPFSADQSRFAFARNGDKAGRPRVYLVSDTSTLGSSPESDPPWRAACAAGSALMTKAATGLAICSEAAVANILLAVMSWMFAQALAGCAAYAEAMYPMIGDEGESTDCRDPLRDAPSVVEATAAHSDIARDRDHCE
jgi:hypothetical protein